MIKQKIETFIYKKVIRNLMLTSKLGRQSVLGEAASGYNFDHMYENKAEGSSLIGRLVDNILLRLPAVKATRNRKSNIIRIIKEEVVRIRASGKKAKIMDVACGAGRYLAEINSSINENGVETVGVDYDTKSIHLGKSLANSYHLPKNRLRFVKGNVFRLDHLKTFGHKIDWKPNIILASGLIVYLDDDTTKGLLNEACQGLDRDGVFIFSSQQNNPSKKLMEKVCTTSKGAWVLYYREPQLLFKWLVSAGFKDVNFSTDHWQMYNLFIARK